MLETIIKDAEAEIRKDEKNKAAARLAAWKLPLRTDDGAVWRWLKRTTWTTTSTIRDAAGQIFNGSALCEALEEYWKTFWPEAPPASTRSAFEKEAPPRAWVPAPALRPITVDELRQRLKSTANKATGLDGWSTRELAAAPDACLAAIHDMHDMLHAIETGEMEWPSPLRQWRQVHLPKDESGGIESLRPVSIAATIYRTWCIRLQHLRTWLAAVAPASVCGAIPGRSTMSATAALILKFMADEQFLAILDFSKAFDCTSAHLGLDSLRRAGLPEPFLVTLHSAWLSQERWVVAGSRTRDQ